MGRFFSQSQRKEHENAVGRGCEFKHDHERCGRTPTEYDHVQPFSRGGDTVEENSIQLCKCHHACKHLLDEDYYSAKLIESRMNKEELVIYWFIRKELGL